METLRWPILVFAGLAVGGAVGRLMPDITLLHPGRSGGPAVAPVETTNAPPIRPKDDSRPAESANATNTVAKPNAAITGALSEENAQVAPAPGRLADQLLAAEKSGADFRRTRDITRIVDSIPADQMPTVLTETISRSGTGYPQGARFLVERLTSEQPNAALKWLKEMAPQDHRARYAGSVFGIMAARDSAAAKAMLSEITDPEIRNGAARAVGIPPKEDASAATRPQEYRSATDVVRDRSLKPAQVSKLLAQFPPSEDRISAIGSTASAWCRENPVEALRWAQSLQVPGERQRAIKNVLSGFPPEALVSEFHRLSEEEKGEAWSSVSQWASKEPEAAARWLEKQPAWNTRAKFADIIAGRWAEKDPLAAAAFAQKELPIGKRLQCRMHNIAGKWAETDPRAALAWATTLKTSTVQHDACIEIMEQWSKTRPQEAAVYATSVPKGGLKDELLAAVAKAWGAVEPRKALSLAQQINAASERETTMLIALGAWTEADADAAGRYLYEIPSGRTKESLMRTVAHGLVKSDPQRALAWAIGFPDPKDRREALCQTVSIWASAHADAAAAYVATISDAETRDRVAPDVARQLAMKSPEMAARWAASLAEGKGRQDSLIQIMHGWMEKDEGAAARWLDGLPDGPSRDAAVSCYIYRLMQDDPEAAFRWSESVQDEQERRQLIGSSASSWLRKDPVKARAALDASEIPQQDKQMLIKMSQEFSPPN